MAFGLIGGAVGAVIGSAISSSEQRCKPGSAASKFPALEKALLVATDQRWVVFKVGLGGGLTSVAAHWRRHEVIAIHTVQRIATAQVNIVFCDDSIAQVETKPGDDPKPLVAAVLRSPSQPAHQTLPAWTPPDQRTESQN